MSFGDISLNISFRHYWLLMQRTGIQDIDHSAICRELINTAFRHGDFADTIRDFTPKAHRDAAACLYAANPKIRPCAPQIGYH